MARWLMKSEPFVYSIDDLKKDKTSPWTGVRNYEARNFMKAMKVGEPILYYHSSVEPPGVAGLAEVSRLAYPDPSQYDKQSDYYDPKATPEKPIWFHVDVKFVKKFPALVTRETLQGRPELEKMKLFTRNRLSVTPVTDAEWELVLRLAGASS